MKKKMKFNRYAKERSQWVVVDREELRIIPDELWNAAQANALKNTKRDFGHGPKRAAYALTGLIVCGICGNKFAGHWQQNADGSNRYHYYRCRSTMSGECRCANPSKIRGAGLEQALVGKIENELLAPPFLAELVDELLAIQRSSPAQAGVGVLDARLQELNLKIANLTRALALAPNVDEIARQAGDYDAERRTVENRIAKLKAAETSLSSDEICAAAEARRGKTLAMLKTQSSVAELRIELSRWIETVKVDGAGQVWVKWKPQGVYDLLDLEPALEMGECGSPFAHFRSKLAELQTYHPVILAGMSVSAVSGFSGFSGVCHGFSGMAPLPAMIGTGISGFSGASLTPGAA